MAVSGEVAVVGCYGSSSVSGEVAFFERNPRDGDATSPGPLPELTTCTPAVSSADLTWRWVWCDQVTNSSGAPGR